jgi:cyclopropane-fatty-acyl-phospholipid synthase
MYEHVGLRNMPVYFSTIERLLKPGGAVLNHGITVSDPDGRSLGPAGGEFIDRYVFPGGELPHLSRVIYEIARSGLEIADVEDLRPHYARTLRHWVERLEGSAERAAKEAGPERYRIWRMYMAGMGYAFDRGWTSVAQVLAYKPAEDGMTMRPWTREYQYGGELTLSGPSWTRRIMRTSGPVFRAE